MKAILIVDIPDDLKYEDLYFDGVIRYTSEFDRGYVFLKETGRCLLKPLPDKIDQGYPPCGVYYEGYGDGWDDCIDKILGGEE